MQAAARPVAPPPTALTCSVACPTVAASQGAPCQGMTQVVRHGAQGLGVCRRRDVTVNRAVVARVGPGEGPCPAKHRRLGVPAWRKQLSGLLFEDRRTASLFLPVPGERPMPFLPQLKSPAGTGAAGGFCSGALRAGTAAPPAGPRARHTPGTPAAVARHPRPERRPTQPCHSGCGQSAWAPTHGARRRRLRAAAVAAAGAPAAAAVAAARAPAAGTPGHGGAAKR
jgi:hypothetical protein